MDSSKSGRIGGVKAKDAPAPTIVPFQGIGTRLRRSRSRDHSNELDNFSSYLEIGHLKQNNRGNFYDGHVFTQGGTLERPKRLYSLAGTSFVPDSNLNTFMQPQQQQIPSLYGVSRSAKGNPHSLYEESRLLTHQYEEPHLILDHLSSKGMQSCKTVPKSMC